MLRGVIISPDDTLRSGLESKITEIGQMILLRSFDRYLSPEELHRFHRAHSPQVIFLDIASDESMLEFASQIPRQFPGVIPVALHHQCEPGLLMRLMNAGVREFVFPPFAKDLLLQTIARMKHAIRETPVQQDSSELVFGFLPAKAGTGSSTLATNVASAMTRALESKVLLTDFDINSGIARFLLKLTNAFSIQDVIERIGELDDALWTEIVCSNGSLDILASGPIQRAFQPQPGAIRRLLDFARRRYKAICIDLSGNLEDYCVDVLNECRRVLMVVQPDLPTVYLAREKLRFLRSIDLEDRVSIVLNRWHRNACLSMADIESVIGLPIQYTLSEDAEVVYRALLTGTPIDPASELGKEMSRLAIFLAEARAEKPEVNPKRRMVEYFSLLPARYTLFPGPGR